MNKLATSLFVIGLSASALVGCTNTELGTTTGAAAGAGLGYAVSDGSFLGTTIGAGTGAVLGNTIGADQDRRAYYGYPYYYYY